MESFALESSKKEDVLLLQLFPLTQTHTHAFLEQASPRLVVQVLSTICNTEKLLSSHTKAMLELKLLQTSADLGRAVTVG